MTTTSLQLAGVVTVFILTMVLIALALSRISRARAEAEDGIGAEAVAAIEREFEVFSGIFAIFVIHFGFVNCVNAIRSYF